VISKKVCSTSVIHFLLKNICINCYNLFLPFSLCFSS